MITGLNFVGADKQACCDLCRNSHSDTDWISVYYDGTKCGCYDKSGNSCSLSSDLQSSSDAGNYDVRHDINFANSILFISVFKVCAVFKKEKTIHTFHRNWKL